MKLIEICVIKNVILTTNADFTFLSALIIVLKTEDIEIKNEYIKLMEDISINEKIYKAKYSFQPIIGQDYFLYLNELGEEFLSIIAPQEWGRKKFEHLGTFQLQTDGRWVEIKLE